VKLFKIVWCLENKSELASPAFLGDSGVVQVPCRVHHQLEVLVIVNGHGHVVVVFNPLIIGDLAVSGSLVVQGVVHLECVQEFQEDVVFCLLASLHIRVHLSIVGLLDVIKVQHA